MNAQPSHGQPSHARPSNAQRSNAQPSQSPYAQSSQPPYAPPSNTQPSQPHYAQPSYSRTRSAMRTAIYLLGLLTILGALAWAALLLGVPSEWIGVGALFGLGVVLVKGTRYSPHQR